MKAAVTFFPVGNGDMTLITLNDNQETRILIDMHIRSAADDEDDDTFDVAGALKDRLREDDLDRPYVDVFIQTHPDKDHLGGISRHFHLDSLSNYDDEEDEKKIIINEIWSSPIVWRRADKRTGHSLCDDAKAFVKEVKRRIAMYQEEQSIGDAGDRVLIIGKDEGGKTEGLEEILYLDRDTVTKFNNFDSDQVEAFILGPLPKRDDEEFEEYLTKNRSSIIIQWAIAGVPGGKKTNHILTTGDAEVGIWKTLWDTWGKTDRLSYDILLTPHHCSWHSLSEDSRSKSEDPQVHSEARQALSQAKRKAVLIASSKQIADDESDPPCWAAKKVYEEIAKTVSGEFYCTGEYPAEEDLAPIEIFLTTEGPQKRSSAAKSSLYVGGMSAASAPRAHG